MPKRNKANNESKTNEPKRRSERLINKLTTPKPEPKKKKVAAKPKNTKEVEKTKPEEKKDETPTENGEPKDDEAPATEEAQQSKDMVE